MKSFPSNPEKRKLWLKLIDSPDWNPSFRSKLYVCEAHFTWNLWESTEDGKRQLIRDAVPTIFPIIQRTPEPKSILQKNVQLEIADEVVTELMNEKPKSVNKPLLSALTEEKTKNPTDDQKAKNVELPKVILILNPNKAVQLKRIPEPKSILQKNVEPKIGNGVPIELIKEEQKIVNRPIFPPLSEDQMKKLIDSCCVATL